MTLSPASLLAQAWVPPRGELYFGITDQWLKADNHLFSDEVLGSELTPAEELWGDLESTAVDAGQVRSHVILLDADFGITDRFALRAGLAFVQAKWIDTGSPDSLPDVPALDDGTFHGGFQDARIGARYMVLNGSWVLTPSAAFVLPVTDYPIQGHVAIGRGLKESQLGVNFGRLLNIAGTPRAYLQGNYTYTVMEDIDIVSLDRSKLQLEVGFFHRAFAVQVFGAWEKIHGGIEWHNIGADHHTLAAVEAAHDQVPRHATSSWEAQ